MKKIKAKFGYFTDKNSVVLTDVKPTSDNYLKNVKITLDKQFKMKAKNIDKYSILFDKPLTSVNDDLDCDSKSIVKKRSIFSKFRKEKHVKAGTYENVKKFEYVTNNLNISIV